MSHQLTAITKKEKLLTAGDINAQFAQLGLPCAVAATASLRSLPGSFTATITDRSLSRDICFEDASYMLDEIPDLRSRIGDRDLAINFLLGADMTEYALVSSVCAALAAAADAVIYYEPDDLYYSPAESLADAQSVLASSKLK